MTSGDAKEAYRELLPGPARDIGRGSAYPYDPSGPTRDWAHAAARGILADLCDRAGIKDEFAKIEDNYQRAEIVEAIASIIRAASLLCRGPEGSENERGTN
jgi:hypothetical protein